MIQEGVIRVSQRMSYIKTDVEERCFYKLSVLFVFALFVLPQYFGFQIAGFDITAQRMTMIILMIFIMGKQRRWLDFIEIIKTCKFSIHILAFMAVLFYTAVFRFNVNTFLYSFIEFLCFYLLIYIIKDVFGIEKFVSIIIKLTYILCIQGLIEYGVGYTLFRYLATIPSLYTGSYIRSGSYRIMGPCNHALGYGLLLLTVVPITCIDVKKSVINILQNKLLLILLIINIFLTGSRSTLALLCLELFLLLIYSNKYDRKKTLFYFFGIITGVTLFVIAFYNTPLARYIMLQVTSLYDELAGTEYAVKFGAEVIRLQDSSNYRKMLPYIFTLDWLNPLIGRGSTYVLSVKIGSIYIKSIDNFYVAHYIRFAYPGLITFVVFMLCVLKSMHRTARDHKSGIVKSMFIGSLCYFINLWWLDSLMTLKYVYILFAIFYVIYKELNQGVHNNTKKSRYFQ
ncbi:hypothetical protein [Clostridium sp. Marseille-P299]|uniref:hypothetical protein n=1 Tax=Clostridium sp. Marseille-P299 TaxID=1805477 RepID=UPI0008338462|nr:hypothetical protein [Clostridium sp. Marseille-P299]